MEMKRREKFIIGIIGVVAIGYVIGVGIGIEFFF